ncbi:hypothetical protein WJX74_007482 [Apatococcus lobatus]|uniref:Saccharopine dehydrogenase-like C-terminal domain-containing protein n=1 Tax=Apatococcus lobatus TaxID=904363 RepID=A0AAW1RSU4_9CHLO
MGPDLELDLDDRRSYSTRVISKILDNMKIPYEVCRSPGKKFFSYRTKLLVDVSSGKGEILMRVETDMLSAGPAFACTSIVIAKVTEDQTTLLPQLCNPRVYQEVIEDGLEMAEKIRQFSMVEEDASAADISPAAV